MSKRSPTFVRRPACKAMLSALAIAIFCAGQTALTQIPRVHDPSQQPIANKAVPQVHELLRFDPVAHQWRRLPLPNPASNAVADSASGREVVRSVSGAVITVLPQEIGLYLLRWTENNAQHESQVFIGPVGCNDLMMGVAPAGMIAACVPSSSQGMAMFVPVPPPPCDP